jgi:hypothetical protein
MTGYIDTATEKHFSVECSQLIVFRKIVFRDIVIIWLIKSKWLISIKSQASFKRVMHAKTLIP